MSQSFVRVDHNYQGFPGGIASYLLPGPDLTLIEAGPASTTDTLLTNIRAAGYDPFRITRVVVTHIHLDHAGAAGTLMRRLPHARVFVHPKGAKHLIDPSKLIASAERIYGDKMAELWGEILPVPADRVVVVGDNEMVGALRALDTPGHAVHHHAYYHEADGVVFAGDVAGVRVMGSSYVRPPTPPPELDLDAWAKSIERLHEIGPRRLCLTHFGEFDDVDRHLDALGRRLDTWRDVVRDALAAGQDTAAVTRLLAAREPLSPDLAAYYERVGNLTMCVEGFARYFAKRGAMGS
jgi:glyoxylase-like metal-dependent hydrolase (beta-lactamase superfamily II)